MEDPSINLPRRYCRHIITTGAKSIQKGSVSEACDQKTNTLPLWRDFPLSKKERGKTGEKISLFYAI
jgi:hypothetical protein